MSRPDENDIRQILKTKYRELCFTSRDRDAIAVEATSDEMELMQGQMSAHITMFAFGHRASVLKSVRDALDRLEADLYGVCIQCEAPISEKRLAALPWAPYCVSCQEQVDARQSDEEDGSTYP
jgi:DnaK suppressor protein